MKGVSHSLDVYWSADTVATDAQHKIAHTMIRKVVFVYAKGVAMATREPAVWHDTRSQSSATSTCMILGLRRRGGRSNCVVVVVCVCICMMAC